MKEYKNYSNKKIILFLYIAVIINTFDILFRPYTENTWGTLFISVINILLITVNIKETYLIDDVKIIRKKLSQRYIQWDNINKVEITNWYIKIESTHGTSFKILKKKNYYDLFEDMKMEILSRTNDNNIIFKPGINEDTIRREGGLRFLFTFIIIGVVLLLVSPIFVIEIFNTSFLFDTITSTISILLYLPLSIFALILAIDFSKNKRKTIDKIRKYSMVFALTMSANAVLEFIKTRNQINFLIVVDLITAFVYFMLVFYIVKEYLETSNRVKYYFVK